MLDGVNDYVDIPDQTYAGDFTIAAWVKMSGVIDNGDAILGQGGPGADMNFYEGKLRLFTGGGDAVAANTSVQPNVWTHYAIVRGGGVMTLYMDGAVDAQGTWTGTFAPKAIGWGNMGTLGGSIDDLRMYPRALTAAEVGTLAASEPFGLVASYQLDDGYGTSARDAVLGGAPAPVLGGPTWENGARGVALQLDGVNDAIDIPDLSFTGDFTVAAWVRLTGDISNLDGLVGQNGTGQDINFFAGKMRLYAPGDVVVANTPIEPNIWTHCAITRQGTTLRLYLDGAQDATGTWAGTFAPKMIGRGSLGYFGGALDDVRFYDEALSEGQVQLLARHGSQSALASWTMDDGSGTVAVDAMANGYDAQCSAAAPAWTSTGQSRGALTLNGTSDWLDPGDIHLTGDFTVAGWVKLAIPIDNADSMVGQPSAGPDINFWAQKARLYSASPSGDIVVGNNLVPPQTFTHVAITRRSGRVSLYQNGVKDTSALATNCWFGELPIAALGRGEAGYFGGALDDVVVYERALRVSEIERLADDIPSRLVGFWMFNEGAGTVANDASGTGNSGTLSGGPTWTTGKNAGGLSFDGVNDWVDIPDFSIANDFTLMFWINLAPGITNVDSVVGRPGPGQDVNFYGGKLRLFTGSADVIVANTAATAGVWTQYAITRQGTTLRLYVNGVLDATGSWNLSFVPAAIGRGNAGFLGGTLDDVRIYMRALSAAELLQ